MTKLLTALVVFSFGAVSAVPPKTDDGPIEIDFSPLPGMGDNVKYQLHFTLKAADGSTFEQGYNIGANNAPADVAELILESLPKEFEAKCDGAKLILTSLNGKPITKLDIATTGLPQGANPPKVRRLPKKEPDEKKPEKK